MSLTNYRRGADKERRIVNKLRKEGWICARSAGSHSPIDVWAINLACKQVLLIQSKLGKNAISKKEEMEMLKFFETLEGQYFVRAELWKS